MRAGLPRSSRTFRTRAHTLLPLGSGVPPVSRGVAQSIHFPAPCVAVMERSLCMFRKEFTRRGGQSVYWFANKTSAMRYSAVSNTVGDAVSVPGASPARTEADCFPYSQIHYCH